MHSRGHVLLALSGRFGELAFCPNDQKYTSSNAAAGVLKGDFSGLRRIRIGAYRVVYEAQDHELVVLVIRIGHRRDVYR